MIKRILSGIFVLTVLMCSCKKEDIHDEVEHWRVYPHENLGITNNHSSLHPYAIYLSSSDEVYALSQPYHDSVNIHYFNDNEWARVTVDPGGFSSSIYEMIAQENGVMWALGGSRVFELKDGVVQNSYEVMGEDTAGLFSHFNAMEISPNGLWILHPQWGLFELNTSSGMLERLPDTIGYEEKRYSSLESDPFGRLWVIRNDSGAVATRYDPVSGDWVNHFSGYFSPEEPGSYSISQVQADNYGRMLLLQKKSTESYKVYYLFSAESYVSISTMMEPEDFITPNNYSRLVMDYFSVIHMFNAPANESVISKFLNGFWQDRYDATQPVDGNVTVSDVKFDSSNRMWLATSKGIMVYSETGF